MLLNVFKTVLTIIVILVVLSTSLTSMPNAEVEHKVKEYNFSEDLKQLSIQYTVYPYISNFPKPFQIQFSNEALGMLKIKLEKIEFPYEVEIFDQQGKTLRNAMYTFQKEVNLSLNQFERGSYIIAISTSNKKLYDYSMLQIK